MARIGILFGIGALSVALIDARLVEAETAIKVESCAEVAAAWSQFNSSGGAAPGTAQCWDFEGSLQYFGWTTTGTAFTNQPTYGDNVGAQRIYGPKLDLLNAIGGDYWQTPHPIGHQGDYWIGTYENRNTPYYTSPWGTVQGDAPIGVAYSPGFVVNRNIVTFLIGGGCDKTTVYVELQVYEPARQECGPTRLGRMVCLQVPAQWKQAVNAASGEQLVRSGFCSELLIRDGFYTDGPSGLQGKTARIAVVDNSSGSWGHINLDHVLHTNAWPNDKNGANQPVWGLADTHAHPGNHLSLKSLGTTGIDGYAFHGNPGTLTTDHAVLAKELASCDGQGHRTNHAGRIVIGSFETMSLGESHNFPAGCDAGLFGNCLFKGGHHVALQTPLVQQHWGGGVLGNGVDLMGWPYWYTRLHQQMHLTWVRRAYEGGQRLMVASAGNTEVIGMAMRASHLAPYLSDYGALRRFAVYMKAVAGQNSSWMEIALTPRDARRIIGQNKLAIVLATEVDDLGDKCGGDLASAVDDDPLDHNNTITTEGVDPWNQEKDRSFAGSCATPAEWTARVANLYAAGYRVVMPVHLSDNALGGAAVYSDAFNTMSRFNTGQFYGVKLASDVRFTLTPNYDRQAGWTSLGATGFLFGTPLSVSYSPTEFKGSRPTYPYQTSQGHINSKDLTAHGMTVIAAARARGMIIDLAHMGQLGRESVLGVGSTYQDRFFSPLNYNCDMSLAACQASAYPAIASHAGLRELSVADVAASSNEGGLRKDMIERIRAIGGTVAVGTSGGDLADTNDATGPIDPTTGSAWAGIFSQGVANTCAGSSRTFAQGYVYVLRRMQGKGVTLGTDINGLEAQVNPRFGTQGCYARGNIPWSLQIAQDYGGTYLVTDKTQVPFNYRPAILFSPAGGTAGVQRATERQGFQGLNYAHYNGTPPSGSRFRGLTEPPGYISMIAGQQFGITNYGAIDPASMNGVSPLPPLKAGVTGTRTFDLNYDGLAQYGMLPDLLQDARVVGVTKEQLGPLFMGAESLIQAWERGCRMSDLGVSGPGCS